MGTRVYNTVMRRWMNNYDFDDYEYTTSPVFREGYDDPTYMTFRIEFGDWGASVLSRSMINEGISSFVAEKNNYDALPIGLLTCPYVGCPDINSYWQIGTNTDSTVWNDTKNYSAFRYLRSRNEDTRAKYLYYFVNGLFDIQKNTPYMFKKISGLDALENFDPKNGQRLKNDTKITVECYEGLNLKIRTLMEMYRKAAWDDVNQKWILPENMRQFKMIIYVFERRIFHKVGHANDTDSVNHKDIMEFIYDDKLNGDIPVKAYECCPCEFDIAGSQSWKGEYSSDFSGTEETSKLVINVKNVKTYFKNGLLNSSLGQIYDNNGNESISGKINEIMIYDLVESVERNNSNNSEGAQGSNISDRILNSTVNGVRSLFLNKNILFENEDANINIRSYIQGMSLGGTISGKASADDNFGNAYKKANNRLKAEQLQSNRSNTVSPAMDDIRMPINCLYMPNPRGGWVSVLVNGPSWDEHKSFWRNLVDNTANILFGARRQVLLSGCNFTLGMDTWNSTMNYLYYDVPYTSTAIDQPANFINLLPAKYNALKIKQVVFPERTIPGQSYEELDPLRTVPGQTYNTLNPEREQDEQTMTVMNEPREIPVQTMSEMNEPRIPSEQEYTVMNVPRVPSEQEYNELNDPRVPEGQDYIGLNVPRELPDQTYNTLGEFRELPEQEYTELNGPRQLPEQEYNTLCDFRELPEQEYNELGDIRDLPDQTMNNLNEPRIPKDQKYNELNDPREISDKQPDNLMAKLRTLPGFKNVTMNDLRDIPEQELTNLADTAAKVRPEYEINPVQLMDTVRKTATESDMKILKLDTENLEIEKAIMDTLREQMKTFKLQDINETDDKEKQKKKDLANFTKIFTDNAKEIKNAIADNIVNMKNEIRKLSEDSIRELPILDIYSLDKKTEEKKEMSMISLNDMEQLDKNMKILSLNEEQLRQLSFQTLINLHREVENRLNETHNMLGLSKIVNNSVEKPVAQTTVKTSKKKPAQQMMTLAPPRDVPNRNTIVY